MNEDPLFAAAIFGTFLLRGGNQQKAEGTDCRTNDTKLNIFSEFSADHLHLKTRAAQLKHGGPLTLASPSVSGILKSKCDDTDELIIYKSIYKRT